MNMLVASSLRGFRSTPSFKKVPTLLAISTQLTRPVHQQIRYEGGAAHTGWKIQKLTAGITYVSLPVGVIYPHPVLSYTLGICIPVYTYFCLHEIVTDYTNKLPFINFILNTSTIALSAITLVAINYFNMHDVGITQALHSLLTL